jgi:hypothetical protein
MRLTIVCLMAIGCQQILLAPRAPAPNGLATADRAIIFAVEREIRASHLEARTDVCVGFGQGMNINEKEVISELRRKGLKIHANEWCNRGPRGFTIAINAPITEPVPDTYNFVVELGDMRPIRQEGAHFATLLRRGTYTVKCEKGAPPRLVSYSKTCCSGAGKPAS